MISNSVECKKKHELFWQHLDFVTCKHNTIVSNLNFTLLDNNSNNSLFVSFHILCKSDG